jgi:Bacterial mobilisation protein (MobC).
VIKAAAASRGMATNAYIAAAAMHAAREDVQPLPADWREVVGSLVEDRRQIRRVGVLLNQLAKVANTSGQAPDHQRILTRLAVIVARLDALTARAAGRLR